MEPERYLEQLKKLKENYRFSQSQNQTNIIACKDVDLGRGIFECVSEETLKEILSLQKRFQQLATIFFTIMPKQI